MADQRNFGGLWCWRKLLFRQSQEVLREPSKPKHSRASPSGTTLFSSLKCEEAPKLSQPRDEMTNASGASKDLVELGLVVRAHGIRGELVVRPASVGSELLLEVDEVQLEHGGVWRPLRILRARTQKNSIVLALEDVADRNAAEALRGARLLIGQDQLPPPEEGEYYVSDLIGLKVLDTEGQLLGSVVGFEDGGRQSWFEVELEDGERRLVPFSEGLVEVDLESGSLVVDAPEGLLSGEML